MTYKERFKNIQVLKLDTTSFDELPEEKKMLAYHLSNAGLAGRMIYLHQKSSENIHIFESVINLYKNLSFFMFHRLLLW